MELHKTARVCSCGAAVSEERRCRHCRVCSAAASRSWRLSNAAAIAGRRKQKRSLGRLPAERASDIARAKLYVYLRRGKIPRSACACGSWAGLRPYFEQLVVPDGVRWHCDACRSAKLRGEFVPAAAEEVLVALAPDATVDRRGRIAADVAALPGDLRAIVDGLIARRRPVGVPAALWRSTSILWRDAAIAAYDEAVL